MPDTKVSEPEKLEILIISYKKETDTKKKHVAYLRLIEESLKLVKRTVQTFSPLPKSIQKEDLIQAGAVGVLKAVESYKPEERGSFKTYVTKVIRGKILHYLRDKVHIIRPPRENIEYSAKIKEAIRILSENSEKTPTIPEISAFTDIPAEKIEEVMNNEFPNNMISLDQNIYTNDGGETLLDRICDEENENFEETYANKKIIEYAIGKLPEYDRTAIKMYYLDGCSRKDVADKLNVSLTQVSRILKRALNKLYVIIQKEMSEEKDTNRNNRQ